MWKHSINFKNKTCKKFSIVFIDQQQFSSHGKLHNIQRLKCRNLFTDFRFFFSFPCLFFRPVLSLCFVCTLFICTFLIKIITHVRFHFRFRWRKLRRCRATTGSVGVTTVFRCVQTADWWRWRSALTPFATSPRRVFEPTTCSVATWPSFVARCRSSASTVVLTRPSTPLTLKAPAVTRRRPSGMLFYHLSAPLDASYDCGWNSPRIGCSSAKWNLLPVCTRELIVVLSNSVCGHLGVTPSGRQMTGQQNFALGLALDLEIVVFVQLACRPCDWRPRCVAFYYAVLRVYKIFSSKRICAVAKSNLCSWSADFVPTEVWFADPNVAPCVRNESIKFLQNALVCSIVGLHSKPFVHFVIQAPNLVQLYINMLWTFSDIGPIELFSLRPPYWISKWRPPEIYVCYCLWT